MSHRPLYPIVFAVLTALAALPTSAEEATPEAAESSPVVRVTVDSGESASFDETVDVRLVNVEVYVTDRKGRPIEGLTADDFELFEDARPVEISHFAERSGAIVEATPSPVFHESSTSRSATLPFAVDAEALDSGIPPEPTYLVLYFDNAHLRSRGRRQLIDDLQSFLADTDIPHRQVLIASQTPGLHAEAPFGSTLSELIDALQRIDTLPALGEELDRERDLIYLRLNEVWEAGDFSAVAQVQLDQCDELSTVGVRDVSNYARSIEGRVATTLRHLSTLSSALAGMPGVKHLLYLGDGLQLQPGLDLYEFIKETCPQRRREVDSYAQRLDFTRALERLTRHANANRISITSMSVDGPQSPAHSDINWSDIQFTPNAANDFIRTANLRDSLNFMASETGGRAIFDVTRFEKPLDDVARDLSAYYSLAYQPSHYGDNETYLIDVRLKKKRSKYRVRHRLSYRDKPADERMADRLQSALTLGLEENPLSAQLAHGVIDTTEDDTYTVPIAVTVPLDKLVFLPEDGSHLGRLRMQIVARDAEGRATAFHQKQFQVELDPQLGGVASGEHTFAVDLEMREGEHIIAVGLRDETGRETSYLAKKLVVAPTSPDQLAEAGAPTDGAKAVPAKVND
ncbi:MAG: VWA domain-containing protein [Acidobacteriota bacterium]